MCRLYITYVTEQPRQLILASFTIQNDGANRIDPASEHVLLALDRDTDIHHGGMLAFGPDEMLYMSVGDGGGWHDKLDHAQDLAKLFGKILRIDPWAATPYGIPADNPFVDDPTARPEIWAYGLRNPWRFSFDSQGRMWIGDLGQDSIEELNVATPGANFGWNRFEGDRPFGDSTVDSAGFTFPIVQYSQSIGGTIIAGNWYRGEALASMKGTFFYANYRTGRVWRLDCDDTQVESNVELTAIAGLNSFGEDAAGELYAIAIDGNIYRFEETLPEPMERPFPQRLSATGLLTTRPCCGPRRESSPTKSMHRCGLITLASNGGCQLALASRWLVTYCPHAAHRNGRGRSSRPTPAWRMDPRNGTPRPRFAARSRVILPSTHTVDGSNPGRMTHLLVWHLPISHTAALRIADFDPSSTLS